jgi:HD-GYP domain-containing protein (c-di-GMP phosphodiesterase class II)
MEKPLVISFPVHDLNGQCLVQKGEFLTPELFSAIGKASPGSKPSPPFKSHKTLSKDLKEALHHPPYSNLIQDPREKKQLMGTLGETRLNPFILEALDYFKKQDPYTYWHSLHVFLLTAYVGQELIFSYKGKSRMAELGPLHDVGKINVPAAILQKTTPLTFNETEQLHHHALAGAVLLTYHQEARKSLGPLVALEHHERLDGSGYPRGIPPSDPLVEVVALFDIYDALISPRPYRNRPYDIRTGLEVMTGMGLEGKFSRDILKFLISLHRKGRPDYKTVQFSTELRGMPPETNFHSQIL